LSLACSFDGIGFSLGLRFGLLLQYIQLGRGQLFQAQNQLLDQVAAQFLANHDAFLGAAGHVAAVLQIDLVGLNLVTQ